MLKSNVRILAVAAAVARASVRSITVPPTATWPPTASTAVPNVPAPIGRSACAQSSATADCVPVAVATVPAAAFRLTETPARSTSMFAPARTVTSPIVPFAAIQSRLSVEVGGACSAARSSVPSEEVAVAPAERSATVACTFVKWSASRRTFCRSPVARCRPVRVPLSRNVADPLTKPSTVRSLRVPETRAAPSVSVTDAPSTALGQSRTAAATSSPFPETPSGSRRPSATFNSMTPVPGAIVALASVPNLIEPPRPPACIAVHCRVSVVTPAAAAGVSCSIIRSPVNVAPNALEPSVTVASVTANVSRCPTSEPEPRSAATSVDRTVTSPLPARSPKRPSVAALAEADAWAAASASETGPAAVATDTGAALKSTAVPSSAVPLKSTASSSLWNETSSAPMRSPATTAVTVCQARRPALSTTIAAPSFFVVALNPTSFAAPRFTPAKAVPSASPIV